MGNSLPPPAEFDLVGSYARRRGSDVEVVLADPKLDGLVGDVVVRLAHGKRNLDAASSLAEDPPGRRLVVRTPRADLSDGNWTMTLRRDDGSLAPLAARLLVQGERPLVLLWGAKDTPSLVPSARPAVPSSKQKMAAAAGRALDKALTVLPEDQRRKVRKTARTTARKVLG